MFSWTLVLVCSIASALATGACGNSIYNPPVGTSFVTISTRVRLPNNITTPDGVVAMVPIRSGDISGQFSGHLVANLSSETERLLNSSAGVYSSVESRWIFENDKGERILANMQGLTTYSSSALHGLGTAYLATEIDEFYWVNWALFLIEWQGDFNIGLAKSEFFHITTGGRKDSTPIPT